MPSETNYKHIAATLVSGEPLSFKSYPDGSLIVIAPSGKKYKFSKGDVEKASQVQQPKSEQKPQPKRGRPSKK